MATKITIELPDELYQRTQEFARLHQQKMEEAVSSLIEQGLAAEEEGEKIVDWTKPDPVVDREREAYRAMHPKLKEHYLGKYVAIYQGELIDYDDDPNALAIRIEKQYPDTYVFITHVRQELIRTIVVRSPRIIRDKVS
jgi:hypothetical protein